MQSIDTKEILNDFYSNYDEKCKKLIKLLSKTYKINYYYTNNYYKNSYYDYYPLPVIEVKDVCDVVFLDNDEVNIVCKLNKDKAIKFDYDKLKDFDYSICPISDLYDDLYEKGMSYDELNSNIKKCKDKEIVLIFIVPFDLSNKKFESIINDFKALVFYNKD